MFWLGMAGGFLSKGLIGVAIPVVVALCFLGVMQAGRWLGKTQQSVWRRSGWNWCGIAWGPFLAIAPVALWMWLVYREGGQELAYEVVEQSVHRFSSDKADHAAPWHFYVLPLLYLTLPLGIFAGLELWSSRWSKARLAPRAPVPALGAGFVFSCVWIGAVALALSAASAKRLIYLAPMYPGAALASAYLWQRLRARHEISLRWEGLLLATCASGILIFAAAENSVHAPQDALGRAFAHVSEIRKGLPLLLYKPTEGLEGAAVFFTSETIPKAATIPQLQAMVRKLGHAIVIYELAREPKGPPPPLIDRELEKTEMFPFGRGRIVVSDIEHED
jgi:4-amino-4-deoxy-L-arabinose transferase-like glycosyltransferase